MNEPKKDNIMYHTITMLTERVAERDEQLVRATERELALMAHVERLREVLADISRWEQCSTPLDADNDGTIELCEEVLNKPPAQSLAAHDAAIEKRVWNAAAYQCESKADKYNEIRNNDEYTWGKSDAMQEMGKTLRQKAKENEIWKQQSAPSYG